MDSSVLTRPQQLTFPLRFFLATISLSVIAIFASIGDLTHFTWFSLLLFGVYCGIAALGYAERNFWWFITIQVIVIFGVWAMSIQQCYVLTNTKAEVGSVVYFVGNFIMHYVPFLVAVLVAEFDLVEGNRLYEDISGICLGFGIFVLYLGLYRAEAVYGCSISDSYIFLGSCGVAIVLIVIRYSVRRSNPYSILKGIYETAL